MASLDLGKLKISVELNNKEANDGLEETANKVEEVEERGGGGLKRFAAGAGVAFAAVGTATVAAGKALWDCANNAASTADAIDKTS